MSKRPSTDNVIYANFGARKRVTSPEETGQAPAPSASMSPAAMRVLNAALRQTDVGRATRGHKYAAGGHVMGLQVRTGVIEAGVVGSQNQPFAVAIVLPQRTRRELQAALGDAASTAGMAKLIASGDFTDELLDVLLAPSPEEFRFFCDCPDSATVCKHGVALAEVAAKRIDTDPTTLLDLRNLSVAAIEETLRRSAHDVARQNAEPGSEYFWAGRDLPKPPAPKVAPMIDDSDTDLLRHALETVSFTNIDLLNAVRDIEDLYDLMTDE